MSRNRSQEPGGDTEPVDRDEGPSKSRLKAEALELRDLGQALAALPLINIVLGSTSPVAPSVRARAPTD